MLNGKLKIPVVAICVALLLTNAACGINGKSPESLQPGEQIPETPNLVTNNTTPPVTTTCTGNFSLSFPGPILYHQPNPPELPDAWYAGSNNADFHVDSGDCYPGGENFPVSFWTAGALNGAPLPEFAVQLAEANVRGTVSASNFTVVGSEIVHGFIDSFEFSLSPLCTGRATFLVDFENGVGSVHGALYLTFKSAEAQALGIKTGIGENCRFWSGL